MIKLEDKSNVNAPSGAFPYGSLRNNPGDNTGTPVNVVLIEDVMQLMEKIMAESGITPNGLPDNATNGWQLFEALKLVSRPYKELCLLVEVVGLSTTATILNTFNNDLPNPAVWTVDFIGNNNVSIPDLIGVTYDKLDVSLEFRHPTATPLVIGASELTWNNVTGVLSFKAVKGDTSASVEFTSRLYIRIKT